MKITQLIVFSIIFLTAKTKIDRDMGRNTKAIKEIITM
jgi:hypothetical protein